MGHVSIIDEGQIKNTLNPPDFMSQNDRVISFSFKEIC